MRNRFDVNNFISKAMEMDYFELLTYLNGEVVWLDSLRITPKSPHKKNEYEINYYKGFLGEYLFYLRSGIKPALMNDSDFQKTRPITDALVSKGQLKPTMLDPYK